MWEFIANITVLHFLLGRSNCNCNCKQFTFYSYMLFERSSTSELQFVRSHKKKVFTNQCC
jgi:hypothetical protein